MKILSILIFCLLFISGSVYSQTIDKNATKETLALFKNMQKLSKKHTMFAHQHATEYGHGWSGDENRSDVKSVCGSHPAMIGVDISGFSGRSEEAIKKNKKDLRKNVVDTYNRGGVSTISWHMANPVSEGGFGAGGYSHDAQVITYNGPDTDYSGREILIGSNENDVVIVDVTDKANPTPISTISYTNVGYAHQGWFTEDLMYFILGDEKDEINTDQKELATIISIVIEDLTVDKSKNIILRFWVYIPVFSRGISQGLN
mgnify:CR=1 FL=1